MAVRIGDATSAAIPAGLPVPVEEAAPGEAIARFEGSGWFAWPAEPVVWTAPRDGVLEFALNLRPEHGRAAAIDTAAVHLEIVRLGTAGSQVRRAFPPPVIALERVPGGFRARYRDRAGFGLDPMSLRITITTARGTSVRLRSWAPPGSESTMLPLPPPGLPLPPGIHALTATIEDRIGNAAPPARLAFDAAP